MIETDFNYLVPKKNVKNNKEWFMGDMVPSDLQRFPGWHAVEVT